MDGRYVKLEMDDYRKERLNKAPPKSKTSSAALQSVLKEEEEPVQERPPWDSSANPKSYKVSPKELEYRRKLRISHNLQAAQQELRSKRSRKPHQTTPASIKKSSEPSLEVKYDPPLLRASLGSKDNVTPEVFSLPSLEKLNQHSRVPVSLGAVGRMPANVGTMGRVPETQENVGTAEDLAKSLRALEEKLALVTQEYEVLKKDFEAQKASMDTVTEERDKHRQAVKDLSRILTDSQEAQVNMVNLIQGMKSKMEILEKHGLFQVTQKLSAPAASQVRSMKKVSFNLGGGGAKQVNGGPKWVASKLKFMRQQSPERLPISHRYSTN